MTSAKNMKKYFSARSGFSGQQEVLLIARLWFGLMMMMSGKYVFSRHDMLFFEDLFTHQTPLPFPVFMAYLAKGIEFFAGFFLCLGFLTRIASCLIGITMLVATFTANHGQLFAMYGALTFSLCCLSMWFLFFGPGKWSLDHWFFDRKSSRLSSRTS